MTVALSSSSGMGPISLRPSRSCLIISVPSWPVQPVTMIFMLSLIHICEPDCEIHVGVSGPGAVRAALARLPKDAPIDQEMCIRDRSCIMGSSQNSLR